MFAFNKGRKLSIWQLFIAYRYHHQAIGKTLRFSAVICGEKFGKIQMLKEMADKDSRSMALMFMEDRIKENHGQVYNVKERIILVINVSLKKK